MSGFRPIVKRASKERRTSHGRSFSSLGERECFEYLLALQEKGEIKDLKCQVTVRLSNAQIPYIADFEFFDNRLMETVYGEFKGGFETDIWKLKLKLYRSYGPGRLRIYKGRWPRITLAEEVIPK